MATVELESTERLLHFDDEVASLMKDQVYNQRPHLQNVRAADVATEAELAVTESNVQWHNAAESVLRGRVGQMARPVGNLEDEVARMRQEGDRKV